MKIVIEQLSNNEIIEKAKDFIKKTKEEEINTANLKVPEEFQNVLKWWVGLLCWLGFFLLFIPTIWYLLKRAKLNDYLNNQIKVSILIKDYNDFFKENTHFNKIENSDKVIKRLLHSRNNAVKSFESGSVIDSEEWTELYKVNFYDGYSFENQEVIIEYHYYTIRYYTDSDGCRRSKRVRHDKTWKESLVIGNIDFFKNDNKDYIIAANSDISSKGVEKHKLENKNFNKKFQIRTNDKLKSNLVFTPLTQEVLVASKGPDNFIISNGVLEVWGSWFGGLSLTDDIIFTNSDFKKGKNHLRDLVNSRFVDPILKLNVLYSTILQMPIWSNKKKKF